MLFRGREGREGWKEELGRKEGYTERKEGYTERKEGYTERKIERHDLKEGRKEGRKVRR